MREEHLKFSMSFNKDEYEEYKPIIEILIDTRLTCPPINPGDTFELYWDLYTRYFNDCDKKMRALMLLKHKGIMIDCDIEVVNKMCCLFEEFMKMMRDFQPITLTKVEDASCQEAYQE